MDTLINANALPGVLLLAVFVKTVVDYFVAPVYDKQGWDRWTLMYVAGVVGLALGFAANVNLFAPTLVSDLIGKVMTAILIAGGAKLIHDVTDQPAAPAS